MTPNNAIDMLIHVDRPEAKERLCAKLTEYPGVFKSRIVTPKPQLMFLCYDPTRFSIRNVPDIAHSLGIKARIVEV